MTTNAIPVLRATPTAVSDLPRLSDGDLMALISRVDLESAADSEAVASGWSPTAAIDTRRAVVAAEYERRYGVPIPNDRSATWGVYHCPTGWQWRAIAADANRRTASGTASTPAAARSAATAEYAEACRSLWHWSIDSAEKNERNKEKFLESRAITYTLDLVRA